MLTNSMLSFSTLGCPALSFPEILTFAQANGIKAIELRGILDRIAMDALPILEKENITDTERLLASCGIGICVLGCSASFHVTDHTAALAECRYAISAAQALHTPYIRVFGNKCDSKESFARTCKGLKNVCQIAAGSGVTVLLETHGDYNNAEIIGRVLSEVDCDTLGLLWDVEHTYLAGQDAEAFVSRFSSRIFHVHMKNVDKKGALCLPGEGVIPLRKTAEFLLARGYTGLFSLEWEKRWRPELSDIGTAFDDYRQTMQAID